MEQFQSQSAVKLIRVALIAVFLFGSVTALAAPDRRISDNDGHVMNINSDGSLAVSLSGPLTMSGDLEMGNTPYSIDGGTGGLAFDPDNDDTNEVVIDASGNVGIGDTAPGTLLQLSNANAYVTLKNTTAENIDGGAETKIIFEDHANAALAQIQASHDGTSDDTKGDLILSTHNGTSLTEALRIDSAQLATFVGAVAATTFNSGSGAMDLGDAAIADDDTDSIPTSDQVFEFCETTQNYLKTSENSDSDDDITDDASTSLTDTANIMYVDQQNAGTDYTTDLEEEVTEGSLADSTIVSADIKDGEVTDADILSTDDVMKIQFVFVFDGGGSEIADNETAYVRIPANCTITAWDLTGDVSGAIKIDVWVDTYANYPPDNTDTITNGHEPEIAASGTKAQDLDITDWGDVTLAAGSYMKVSVDSCTTTTYAVLTIYGNKT